MKSSPGPADSEGERSFIKILPSTDRHSNLLYARNFLRRGNRNVRPQFLETCRHLAILNSDDKKITVETTPSELKGT